MPTSASTIPTSREGIADGQGKFAPSWYRFLAKVDKLLNGAITTPGTGLATDTAGTLTIADNGVSNAMLRQSLPNSVIGNPGASNADPQDIKATQDGWALQLDGANLAFRMPRLPRYTVATLPSVSGVGNGSRAFVTDAAATTFASIVAGGGANGVPVYSDGTNWRIG